MKTLKQVKAEQQNIISALYATNNAKLGYEPGTTEHHELTMQAIRLEAQLVAISWVLGADSVKDA